MPPVPVSPITAKRVDSAWFGSFTAGGCTGGSSTGFTAVAHAEATAAISMTRIQRRAFHLRASRFGGQGRPGSTKVISPSLRRNSGGHEIDDEISLGVA